LVVKNGSKILACVAASTSVITQNRPVVITSKPASEGHLIAGQ
jgi:hypothetical protein